MERIPILETIRSSLTRFFRSDHETTTDDTPKICWIFHLPPEILQTITDYLSTRDIISLSRTCQTFYTIINDDNFWIHRIHCEFPQPIADLYTYDVFQKCDTIETSDEPRPSGFQSARTEAELDLAAINSATHYNDQAIEKRHAKMYLSKESFLTQLQYFQYKRPKKVQEITIMKLMYFYLIDRKRRAVVDMDVVHRNDQYLVERNDANSFKGRIIELRNVCWLEITGHFEHAIMPGKYDVIWRMKCFDNYVRISGDTEFSVVPSHGKMLLHIISDDDFQRYALEHGNDWFTVKMGQIVVYDISRILIGIRNWNTGYWKSGIAWDCVELKPAS